MSPTPEGLIPVWLRVDIPVSADFVKRMEKLAHTLDLDKTGIVVKSLSVGLGMLEMEVAARQAGGYAEA